MGERCWPPLHCIKLSNISDIQAIRKTLIGLASTRIKSKSIKSASRSVQPTIGC